MRGNDEARRKPRDGRKAWLANDKDLGTHDMAVALCDGTMGLKLCGSLRHKCDLVMSLWVKVNSVFVAKFQGFNVDQGMNGIKDRLQGGVWGRGLVCLGGGIFGYSILGFCQFRQQVSGVRGYSLDRDTNTTRMSKRYQSMTL